MVTNAQVRRLREKRMSGKTLAAAAAAAGMSERTARTWQRGALPSTAKAPRTWRTREDPFADVWQSEVVPQLVADTDGRLQALTLFKVLCRRHPGRFQAGQLRTLQRRVRDWRVQYGPDREVYFEQVAVPGREAAFDFTDASDLGVTIRGVAFPHLLFEWVLSYSKWTYVGLALSETFEALVSGLQGALWMLGAVPAVLRHDNLSAATHELKRSGGRQLTARFQQVMDHYGLRSSRIQPGKPHENGVAEQAHFRTKTAIEQALLLRGDRDFADESAYLRFVRAVLDEERNRPAAARLAEERLYLQPLPTARIPKRTFTPFGLLRLQNPQQRPPNGASSNEQPSEPARIVDVERQKYLTPNSPANWDPVLPELLVDPRAAVRSAAGGMDRPDAYLQPVVVPLLRARAPMRPGVVTAGRHL